MKKPEGYLDMKFEDRYHQNVKEFFLTMFEQLKGIKEYFNSERNKIEEIIDTIHKIFEKNELLKKQMSNKVTQNLGDIEKYLQKIQKPLENEQVSILQGLLQKERLKSSKRKNQTIEIYQKY